MTDRPVRAVLYVAAAGCLVCVLGAVGPWEWVAAWVQLQYGVEAPREPLFVYGVRVAYTTYAFAGVYFLALARAARPERWCLTLGACGLMVAGLVALVAGVAVGLRPRGYLVDVAFLETTGLLLMLCRPGDGEMTP